MLLFEPTPAPFTSDDWYTPPPYLEAARKVMRGIDLDPASHDLAQEAVKAAHYFTLENNGLNQPWHGRVWLNPPYSMPAIQQFIYKLLAEYQDGNVEQAICLVNNATDTSWFHALIDQAVAVCFTKGRIRFYSPIRTGESPRQGQAFFYFGDDPDRFAETFSAFGAILPCTKNRFAKRVFAP
ncbi:MAG: adenine methyltransferase [Synechococcaceae cyanobacterium SM1_2_3]|nr:adenine methyltransferase [Synechococcaceae cyanobacterium SM1_2_3]